MAYVLTLALLDCAKGGEAQALIGQLNDCWSTASLLINGVLTAYLMQKTNVDTPDLRCIASAYILCSCCVIQFGLGLHCRMSSVNIQACNPSAALR